MPDAHTVAFASNINQTYAFVRPFLSRYLIALSTFLFSYPSFATGLIFWESSAVNTALAAANGAKATDASALALVPASITQLKHKDISISVTHYQVTSDYDIFATASHYEKSNYIPSFFISSPLNQNWHFGIGMYSRTAADISIPKISMKIGQQFEIPLFYETRVTPIIVSASPSLAYRWGALSGALSFEYLYASYEFEQNRRQFGQDKLIKVDDSSQGYSGAISFTWQPMPALSLALKHQLNSRFDDPQVAFNLPSQTSAYLSVQPTSNWLLHASYSQTQWKNHGIYYTQYSDPFGLLVGAKNSRRIGISSSYQLNDWQLMLGFSQDEAIDSLGGEDLRYRLGLSYELTKNTTITAAWMEEHYARKEYKNDKVSLVDVQNNGKAITLGIRYQMH